MIINNYLKKIEEKKQKTKKLKKLKIIFKHKCRKKKEIEKRLYDQKTNL